MRQLERLQVPLRLNQRGRHPVEQLRVGRQLALAAEVLGRGQSMPRPKSMAQARLTMTRAVSGCLGSTSHRARPRRFFGRFVGNSPIGSGGARRDGHGRRIVRATGEDERRPRLRQLPHRHHFGERGEDVLLAAQLWSASVDEPGNRAPHATVRLGEAPRARSAAPGFGLRGRSARIRDARHRRDVQRGQPRS